MKVARLMLSIVSLTLLGGGYLGSQYFYLQGQAPEWARMVDSPPVVWLSLVLLLVALILWVIPDRGSA